MNRTRCCQVLLFIPLLAGADRSKLQWRGPDRPVYVITQNHYAEGFTPEGDTAKFGDLLAIEIYSPIARAAEQDASYNVGESLALFVGGQHKGEVKIEKVLPLQCDSSAAVVSAGPSVHLTKDTMALASNSDKILQHANAQRQTSGEEAEFVKRMAMDEFLKHGVQKDLANQIKLEQSIVTTIDKTGDKWLIAYAYVELRAARHEVFLIGKLKDSSTETELARYHKTTDLQDGKDSEGYRFKDQLDLDGDGTDEIVVEVTGYESEEFRILKRVNGGWTRVHVGGQGGC